MIQLALQLRRLNCPRLVYRMTMMPGMAYVPGFKEVPTKVFIYIRIAKES